MKQIAFSIPIYKFKVNNWHIKKKKLLELFDNCNHKVIGNVTTSPTDMKIDILLEEIKLFENEMGSDFYCKEAWFQQYERNMDHTVHDHGAIGYSSVCFIEYDRSKHEPTTFVSPFHNSITKQIDEYKPDVIEGDIIFFPSYLPHYVPLNVSDVKRTVLSFNLKSDKRNETIMGVSYN